MTKKIYLEPLKSGLRCSILHYLCGSCAIFFPNISFFNPSSHSSMNTFVPYGVAAAIAKKSIKTLQIILYKIHMNVRFYRVIISPHMDGILENTL